MVDATDRERIDDCRQELAGLLLEEVCASLQVSGKLIELTNAASLGRQLACLQEQERRAGLDERGRDTQGGRRLGMLRLCWRANADGVQGLRLDAIKTHKWHIMTCSAMTGLNLQQGLEWVVQDAKARLFLY